jgi:MFS family permease
MPLREFLTAKSTRNQYFAAISGGKVSFLTNRHVIFQLLVNLITLSHGVAIGWLSPSLPYLRSDESHLTTGPLTSENVSWIGSLSAVGAFFGAVIFGKVSQKFGQKLTLVLLVVPHLCFWTLVYTSKHVFQLYVARVCAGLTGGGTIRTLSMFVTEISEKTVRGELGSYLILFLSTGNLIIFFAGTYLSFFKVPLTMIVFPLLYLTLVSFLPDSPPSLMARNKPDEAWDSLLFYRSVGSHRIVTEDFKEEYEDLKKSLQNKGYDQCELKDFCRF